MKLNLSLINIVDFYVSFFEKRQISNTFKSMSLFGSHLNILDEVKRTKSTSKNQIIESFPNYLDFNIEEAHIIKRKVKPGLAINLIKKYNSVDDYLKTECSNSFKKVTIRYVKRLEQCFNITYKTFFGDISKSQCEDLMNRLNSMIENRFTQRSGRNKALNNWDYFKKAAYTGINNKTASLFVIYDESKPIKISLNFHIKSIMVGSVSSYDLNYSKFSLGNIGIYKEIEWCINNQITLFDIGFGDFLYKRKWSNLIYDFETHYISKKNNLLNKLIFYVHNKKSKFTYYIVSKEYNNFFYDNISRLKNKKVFLDIEYNEFDIREREYSNNLIDTKNKVFEFLKKPTYDLMYKYQEHVNDIKIYKSSTSENTYIIKGKKIETGIKFINI